MNISRIIAHYFRLITSPLRRNPDFIIIGVQKGGTTSLYNYLCMHPDIIRAHKKEIHYFKRNSILSSLRYRSHFPLKYFHTNKITGEASPDYFFHSMAANRIKRDCPNIKLILLLRHPVYRAYSHYHMEVRNGYESSPDFVQAIKIEEKRIKSGGYKFINNSGSSSAVNKKYSYIRRGRYYKQLIQWHESFSKDQILVLKSENLFSEPNRELQRVHQFLGIRHIPIKKIKVFCKGHYKGLEEVITGSEYRKLKMNFRKDIALLSKELGNEFLWDIPNGEIGKECDISDNHIDGLSSKNSC